LQQDDFSVELEHFDSFLEQDVFSDLEHFDSFLEQEVFSDLEHFDSFLEQEVFSDLEQDFFFSPLQQVPSFFFSQVSSHTFPVLEQTFSVLFSTFSSVVVCAFTLVIPIKRKANNTIDIFFMFLIFVK
tara:strand:- start:90 stop:473 length:384 start_codon:yes stop_codon:yes gene_type:complete